MVKVYCLSLTSILDIQISLRQWHHKAEILSRNKNICSLGFHCQSKTDNWSNRLASSRQKLNWQHYAALMVLSYKITTTMCHHSSNAWIIFQCLNCLNFSFFIRKPILWFLAWIVTLYLVVGPFLGIQNCKSCSLSFIYIHTHVPRQHTHIVFNGGLRKFTKYVIFNIKVKANILK